jgi:plastocyanin
MVGSLAVLAIVLAACANGGEASPVATESPGASTPAALAGGISIVDFGFEPVELTVATGATVTWTNTGEATPPSSGAMARRERWMTSSSRANVRDNWHHTFAASTAR